MLLACTCLSHLTCALFTVHCDWRLRPAAFRCVPWSTARMGGTALCARFPRPSCPDPQRLPYCLVTHGAPAVQYMYQSNMPSSMQAAGQAQKPGALALAPMPVAHTAHSSAGRT